MPLNIGKIGTFVNNMVCKPLNAIGNMKIMNGGMKNPFPPLPLQPIPKR